MPGFTHLHVHTEMSLLDGLARINELIRRAKELGMTALAITDHGSMYGALDFYDAARKQGIKPIIGCETYLAPGGIEKKDREIYHLVLLAKNEIGYRNLIQLVSKASVNGFYYKPRIDLDLLRQHSDGLIALSACLNGQLASSLSTGNETAARQAALEMDSIFGHGNFYVELMDHGLPEQKEVNKKLITMARELGLALVATNDVHYVLSEDAYAQEVLLCIQTGNTMDDPKHMRMESNEFYLRSPEEMAALFPDVPEAIENTQRIAADCNLDLQFGEFYLPDFPVPAGHTPATYLEELCRAGLKERYPVVTPEIEERLRHELDVIERMGFPSYFLVVWDFVDYARRHSIPVGPGRGSAAGSIVSYCLGITSIDPLRHNLIFERFLNPDRISMPDIDMDFADDGRDEVIRYVTEKYGSDHVAQIITFGTMAARASVRDVGRALGLPYGMVDQVAKIIPPNTEIDKALEAVPELKAMYSAQEEIRQVIDVARRLEGGARHASTHAAGVVISRNPLSDHVPLQKASRGEIVTQYQMHILEKIGLLKMDFLGLSTLTIMHRTIDLIEQNRGPRLDLDTICLEDPSIYRILCDGHTVGIFQLEGGMTKRMTIDVKPSCFDDVTALMALIRPGPMAMAPDYIQRKHGQLPIEYMHPDMEPILKETYGVALYQEQVMRIANVLAGYSMSEADALRKAMGKKLPEEMKKQGTRFVSGATAHGIKPQLAQEIFDLIERFAGYGFNKAHSAAYAVIACQTAYLKANYPVEYMTAVLTAEQSNSDKVAVAVAECRRMGIEVLPPDVNRSMVDFTVERREKGIAQWVDSIRFGMAAVKNVGLNAIEAIIAAREQAPGKLFQSLEHFCELVDWHQVNRRMVESLIKAGAMDGMGGRAELVDRLDQAISCGQKSQRARDAGQTSLFDVFEQPATEPVKPSASQPVSSKVLLAWEKEALGLYVSSHPLTQALDSLADSGVVSIAELTPEMAGQQVTVAGMLTSMRSIPTKKGQTMVVGSLEDMEGTIELVAFPECYERNKHVLQEDSVVMAEAKVDVRNDNLQLICQSIREIGGEETPERESSPTLHLIDGHGDSSVSRPREPTPMKYLLKIYLTTSEDVNDDIRKMQELDKILHRYPGESYVNLYVPNGSGFTCLQPYGLEVSYCEGLEAEIMDLLGTDSLRAEQAPDDRPLNGGNGNGNGGNGHHNGNGRQSTNGRHKQT